MDKTIAANDIWGFGNIYTPVKSIISQSSLAAGVYSSRIYLKQLAQRVSFWLGKES